jgi:methylphosphotriester-DNA--protein-cysteine methyltransferase
MSVHFTPFAATKKACRARRDRPCNRCAAEQRDESAALHSITSSARASSIGGTVRPRAFAVFKLMTSSYFVGACNW